MKFFQLKLSLREIAEYFSDRELVKLRLGPLVTQEAICRCDRNGQNLVFDTQSLRPGDSYWVVITESQLIVLPKGITLASWSQPFQLTQGCFIQSRLFLLPNRKVYTRIRWEMSSTIR